MLLGYLGQAGETPVASTGLGRVGPSGPGLGWLGSRRSAALCPQDAFQEEYSRTGTFPETPVVPPRRPWTLVNWLFWASLLLYPFFRFVVNMVSSGSSLTLASFVLVFFVGESRPAGPGAGGSLWGQGRTRPWRRGAPRSES